MGILHLVMLAKDIFLKVKGHLAVALGFGSRVTSWAKPWDLALKQRFSAGPCPCHTP